MNLVPSLLAVSWQLVSDLPPEVVLLCCVAQVAEVYAADLRITVLLMNYIDISALTCNT